MGAGLPCAGYLVKILARQRGVASGQEKLALVIKDRILCRQSLTSIVQPYVPEYGLGLGAYWNRDLPSSAGGRVQRRGRR